MTAIELMQNCINTFGDWPKDDRAAQYRKERLMKAFSEWYTDDERELLWDLIERECKFRPRVNEVNRLLPGRKKMKNKETGFVPSSFNLDDEYTTKTAEFLGSGLKDFMKNHKMDNLGTIHEMTESDRHELMARTMIFWDKFIRGLGKVPEKIKAKVFHPERCKNCGKRIGEEREKEEAYCYSCGTNIINPLNVMMDVGADQVGMLLVEKMNENKGSARELKI